MVYKKKKYFPLSQCVIAFTCGYIYIYEICLPLFWWSFYRGVFIHFSYRERYSIQFCVIYPLYAAVAPPQWSRLAYAQESESDDLTPPTIKRSRVQVLSSRVVNKNGGANGVSPQPTTCNRILWRIWLAGQGGAAAVRPIYRAYIRLSFILLPISRSEVHHYCLFQYCCCRVVLVCFPALVVSHDSCTFPTTPTSRAFCFYVWTEFVPFFQTTMENVRIVGRRPGRILPSVRGIGRRAVIYERERRERAENVARRGGGHNDG